jgi:hypothetical protein
MYNGAAFPKSTCGAIVDRSVDQVVVAGQVPLVYILPSANWRLSVMGERGVARRCVGIAPSCDGISALFIN